MTPLNVNRKKQQYGFCDFTVNLNSNDRTSTRNNLLHYQDPVVYLAYLQIYVGKQLSAPKRMVLEHLTKSTQISADLTFNRFEVAR